MGLYTNLSIPTGISQVQIYKSQKKYKVNMPINCILINKYGDEINI
jgi:hypothetical protein